MVNLVVVPDPLFLRAVSHCMLTGSSPVMELLLKGTTISTLDLQQINFGFVVFLLELQQVVLQRHIVAHSSINFLFFL